MAWRITLNQKGTKTNTAYKHLRPFKISSKEEGADADYIGFTDGLKLMRA